ncbi:hypothetical protein C1N53_20495 [Pontibacter sp. SGAir0037]|nr:hypothetical protein C1N53_20495 [Pontibacter sp. SGAir0037]
MTVVLDLADRKVVGWALSETMEAEVTTVAAFQMAVRNRPVFHSLLFHSDRGVQYACSAFQEQLEGMPVQQSMSRKGNCWDNAVAESFFKTMKTQNGVPPQVCHHSRGKTGRFRVYRRVV